MIHPVSVTNKININHLIDQSSKRAITSKGSFDVSSYVFPTAAYSAENIKAYHPIFSASLKGSEEKQKYNAVAKRLDPQSKTMLNGLLRNGVLLDKNSNDGSSVLDNLHKIVDQPRIKGLSEKNILKETLKAIYNPFSITQNFGDMPPAVLKDLMSSPEHKSINPEDLNVRSASCVATSIEFNLASKQPAEFARMAADLSSENYSVLKNLKLTDIAENTIDAIWLLNEFKMPYKMKGWDQVEVTLQPDRNAIIRARVQNSYKDPMERSLVDVLLQSTFMNIGSQNTYDALTDTRTGKYNPDNKGLTDIEKNFAEEIAQGRPKVSVTYQILDENGKLQGYECELHEMQKHILDAINLNNNIIIGYTQFDGDKKVVNGHEITIIGAEKDQNGELVFIYNDTDDNKDEPCKWLAKDLLPLIHHAGLPKEVLKENVEFTEGWREILDNYKTARMNEAPTQTNLLQVA